MLLPANDTAPCRLAEAVASSFRVPDIFRDGHEATVQVEIVELVELVQPEYGCEIVVSTGSSEDLATVGRRVVGQPHLHVAIGSVAPGRTTAGRRRRSASAITARKRRGEDEHACHHCHEQTDDFLHL